MASARYTLNITEEDLAQQNEQPMTNQEKRSNWLHYHKWFLIAGVLALAFLGWFIHDMVTRVVPDYSFAVVTTAEIGGGVLRSLEDQLALHLRDVNGDGRVVVTVAHYRINYDDDSLNKAIDNSTNMATEMRISTDFSTSTSIIFITDSFHGLEDEVPIFAFLDDPYSYPEADERGQYDRMTITWGDSALLRGLALEGEVTDLNGNVVDAQTFFSDFSVAMRTLYDDRDEELVRYYGGCIAFMRQVLGQTDEAY